MYRAVDNACQVPLATGIVGEEYVAGAPFPRVAAGEPGAADECLASYGGLVWTIARRMLGTGPDTEDAVQEIFIELWRSAGRFDPSKGSEVTFVGTIARRRVVDWVRRRTRRTDVQALPEEDPPATDESVGTRAEISDEFERAREALDQIPEPRRGVSIVPVCKGARPFPPRLRTAAFGDPPYVREVGALIAPDGAPDGMIETFLEALRRV